MSETSFPSPDGVARTPTGEIQDQNPILTETPATPPTTTTQTEATPSPENSDKAKEKKPSLLNQKDEKKVESGAPEKYESFKAPDGFVITDDANKQLSELFKEANISQASAQKLIDYIAPQLMEATEAPYKHFQETREAWQKAVNDKYGTRISEVKTTVSRALDSLANPAAVSAFKEAMDLTGAGDNPAFIDVLYELAKRVSEGTPVSGIAPSKFGQGAPGSRPSAAAAMYPTLSR